MTTSLDLNVSGLGQMQMLGQALSSLMAGGQIFGLSGPLGAGKSQLARYMIEASCAGVDDMPSPTFTLVQPYQSNEGFEVWHMDLYRLERPQDSLALGIEEAFIEACCLIEWPERLGPLLPSNHFAIHLEFGEVDTQRHITLTGTQKQIEIVRALFARR